MLFNKKHNESFFDYVCRLTLVFLLFYLPVYRYITDLIEKNINIGITKPFFSYLIFFHEIVNLLLLPYVLYKVFKSKNKALVIIFAGIILVSITGFLSGLINKNELLRTCGGTFIYVKSFLFILLYAVFFTNRDDIKKLYYILRIFALIVAGIALLQELIYLLFHYVLHIDIAWSQFPFSFETFRFGLPRAHSLIKHPNLMGLFLLLFVTMDIFLREKGYIRRIICYSLGIFFSLSRMVWLSFLSLLFLTLGTKKIKIIIITGFCCFLVLLFSYKNKPSLSEVKQLVTLDIKHSDLHFMKNFSFRVYGREVVLDIFFDHPFFGTGPGTFGTAFSYIMPSPVYKEYFYSRRWYHYMKEQHSLDQFWFQCLAELGITGIFSMLFFLVLCFYVLFSAQQQCSDPWLGRWLYGCSFGIFIILIYTAGSGINMTEFIVIWAAFSGMGLGALHNNTH